MYSPFLQIVHSFHEPIAAARIDAILARKLLDDRFVPLSTQVFMICMKPWSILYFKKYFSLLNNLYLTWLSSLASMMLFSSMFCKKWLRPSKPHLYCISICKDGLCLLIGLTVCLEPLRLGYP